MKNLKYFAYISLFLGLISGSFTPEALAKNYLGGIVNDFLCVLFGIILLIFWVVVFISPFYLGNYAKEYSNNIVRTIVALFMIVLTWQYWSKNPRESILKNRPKAEEWQSTTSNWINDKPFNEIQSYFLFYNAHLIAYSDNLFFDKYVKPQKTETLLDKSFAILSAPFFLMTTIIYSFLGTLLSSIFVTIPPYIIFLFGMFSKKELNHKRNY